MATEAGLLILTISGLWLAWLLTALVYLALMAFRALGGQYRRIPDGVEAAAFYLDLQRRRLGGALDRHLRDEVGIVR